MQDKNTKMRKTGRNKDSLKREGEIIKQKIRNKEQKNKTDG